MKKLIIALILLFAMVVTPVFAIEIDDDANNAVDIANGGTNATTIEQARINLGFSSTADPFMGSGVLVWTGSNILAINADTTKFDIAAMVIEFVDRSDPDPANHTKETKTFSAITGIDAAYLTSNISSQIGRDITGAVIQTVTGFTPEQRNSIVQIGALEHSDKLAIGTVYDLPWVYEKDLDWMIEKAAYGAIRLSGAVITANGANLKIDRSIGNFLDIGAGSTRNAINYPQSPAEVQVSGVHLWNSASRESIIGSETTDIDPLHYDDLSGTLADVSAGLYCNIFEYHFPYKSYVDTLYLYGNKEYSSLDNAIAGVLNREYTIPIDVTGGSILAGISVQKETLNLTTAIAGGTAKITPPPFGGGSGTVGPGYWTKTGDDLETTTPGDNLKLTGNIQLGDATIEHENVTHDIIYGSGLGGLNDVTPSGTYTGTGNALFDLEIDGIGTPNTFRWRIDGGTWTSGVAMTGSAQSLQDGISTTWGSTIDHTNNDYWYLNVGHEVHITEPLHVLDDGTFDGDVTIGGVLKTNSPVRIQEGIEILCDKATDRAEFSTTCQAIDLSIGGVNKVSFANDGTIEAKTANYEALVLADNDIPNKKYVDGRTINQTTGWLWGADIIIKAGETNLIEISPGAVQIVTGTDNPIAKIISWDTTLEHNPTLDSYTNWIGIRDDGSGSPEVVNQILYNAEERRYTALLGKVRDNSGTGPFITNIDEFKRPAHGIDSAFVDFVLAFGSFSITGNDITESASAAEEDWMRLEKSSGESFRYHTERYVITAITSLLRSGSLVTATTTSEHNLYSGMPAIVAGAVETDYNGSVIITVTSATTFTYTIATTPSTPATGTITAKTLGRENHHYDAAQLPRESYDYHVQGLSTLVNHTEIQSNLMDNMSGGTIAVPTNKFTRQEIRIWPVSGAFHMTYGQNEYGSMQAAIDNGPEPMAAINTKMTNGAIHIASLVIQQGTTRMFENPSKFKIIPLAGRGGGSGGGGISSVFEDKSPQSGADWDTNGFPIVAIGMNPIKFETNGVEIVHFGGGGNVGIATPSPIARLDVRADIDKATYATEDIIFIGSDDAANPLGLNISIQGDPTSSNRYVYIEAEEDGVTFDRGLLFQRLGGNVGIGNVLPDHKLNIYSLTGVDPFSIHRTDSGELIEFKDDTDTFSLYNRAGTPEANIAADIGSLSIDTSAGDLYVKTTDTVNTGWDKFVRYINDGDITISNGQGLITAAGAFFGTGAGGATPTVKATTATNNFIVQDLTDTILLIVDEAGNVGIGTTTPDALFQIEGGSSSNQLRISDISTEHYKIGRGVSGFLDFQGTQVGFTGYDFKSDDNSSLLTIIDNGNVGIGTSTPTALLDVQSDIIRLRTPKTPASASATGNAGDICWDANYIYICIAANTWERTAISTW